MDCCDYALYCIVALHPSEVDGDCVSTVVGWMLNVHSVLASLVEMCSKHIFVTFVQFTWTP